MNKVVYRLDPSSVKDCFKGEVSFSAHFFLSPTPKTCSWPPGPGLRPPSPVVLKLAHHPATQGASEYTDSQPLLPEVLIHMV